MTFRTRNPDPFQFAGLPGLEPGKNVLETFVIPFHYSPMFLQTIISPSSSFATPDNLTSKCNLAISKHETIALKCARLNYTTYDKNLYLSLSVSLCSVTFLQYLQNFLSLSFSGVLFLLRVVM